MSQSTPSPSASASASPSRFDGTPRKGPVRITVNSNYFGSHDDSDEEAEALNDENNAHVNVSTNKSPKEPSYGSPYSTPKPTQPVQSPAGNVRRSPLEEMASVEDTDPGVDADGSGDILRRSSSSDNSESGSHRSPLDDQIDKIPSSEAVPYNNHDDADAVHHTDNVLDKLVAQIQVLTEDRNHFKRELDDAMDDIEDLEEEIDSLRDKLKRANTRLATYGVHSKSVKFENGAKKG
jgi:hypothetical protein